MQDVPGVVFACADRLGREVLLREDTWYDHILSEHAELVGHAATVEDAVSHPDSIKIDADDPFRRVYYKRNVLSPPFQRHVLKVVVEFDRIDAPRLVRGEVVTAFAAFRVKRQERHEW